jgi:Tfp pilus assembly protein PilO
MPRNFRVRIPQFSVKDPRVAARAILGVLALANIVAALIAFKPWGGSPEELGRQRQQLTQQVEQLKTRLQHTKELASKVEHARSEGDRFLSEYMMDRRTTFSTIVAEMDKAANTAGLKQRERSYNLEAVEGSETISQMTVTSGYEGPYSNLVKFVNVLDKSPRFLVIESLQASPQQGSQSLNILVKLDTFVLDRGEAPPPAGPEEALGESPKGEETPGVQL